MAIQKVDLTPGRSASMDATFVRNSDRMYRVLSDVDDDENFVLFNWGTSLGISIGAAQPFDRQQRCIGLNAQCTGQVAHPVTGALCMRWEVKATFGPWNPLTLSFDGNPTHIPPIFWFDVEVKSVPAITDVNDDPIVNSAGDYYDPPVERELPLITLMVKRNEASPAIASLLGTPAIVNGAAWNGFPPKTVKLNCPKMPPVEYSQATSSFYWPMEYAFSINNDTWVKQVLNRGFRQLNSLGQLVPIYINGQPISDPVFLDYLGHAILTPDYLDAGGDSPYGEGDSGSSGFGDDPYGGGETPEGGLSEEGGSIVPNAYDVYRTFNFGLFGLDNLFTLPSVLT
jgi:hypothetical protein